uniref:Uncharacterized protein n=1 Tax=Arundo donax TaxID=35708 RepID=A0A0A9CLA6_ARUDO
MSVSIILVRTSTLFLHSNLSSPMSFSILSRPLKISSRA